MSEWNPTQHVRDDFGRRLYKALVDQGISQSELAAGMFGRRTDKRGYSVALGRDRISAYITGERFPDRAHLEKMAAILALTAADLAPDYARAMEEDARSEEA
jgi:transcriptional regulator with XRE-family HTH domain